MEQVPQYMLVDNKDGKDVFVSNFPGGMPKSIKQQRVVDLVQNVWQHKPITLTIYKNDVPVEIEAEFDPSLATQEQYDNGVRTDLAKMAYGNKRGTNREQKLTLNLADDLYYITENSKYDYSNSDTGKSNIAHKDVTDWHYFVNDIYYREGNNDIPCTATIDVKETPYGNYFYSFSLRENKNRALGTLPARGTPISENTNATQSFKGSLNQQSKPVNPQNKQFSIKDELPYTDEEIVRSYSRSNGTINIQHFKFTQQAVKTAYKNMRRAANNVFVNAKF